MQIRKQNCNLQRDMFIMSVYPLHSVDLPYLYTPSARYKISPIIENYYPVAIFGHYCVMVVSHVFFIQNHVLGTWYC